MILTSQLLRNCFSLNSMITSISKIKCIEFIFNIIVPRYIQLFYYFDSEGFQNVYSLCDVCQILVKDKLKIIFLKQMIGYLNIHHP